MTASCYLRLRDYYITTTKGGTHYARTHARTTIQQQVAVHPVRLTSPMARRLNLRCIVVFLPSPMVRRHRASTLSTTKSQHGHCVCCLPMGTIGIAVSCEEHTHTHLCGLATRACADVRTAVSLTQADHGISKVES